MTALVHPLSAVSSARPVEELAFLRAVASACAEANNEAALIERVTRVIAKGMYADNLGVLLLDPSGEFLQIHPSYRGLSNDALKSTIKLSQGIAGRVASSGGGLNIHDIAVWEGADPLEQGCFSSATLSVLSLPMKVSERLIGVLHVESSQIGAFVDADERLLATCAGLMATAIERLRAEKSEQQRTQELLAIQRISLEITSILDHQEVLDLIARKAAEISNASASGVYVRQSDGRYSLVAAFGVNDEFVRAANSRGPLQTGSAIGQAIQSRQPFQIPDIRDDPVYDNRKLARRHGIRAILVLPMLEGERVVGGLLIWNKRPRTFSPSELSFLQILAQQSVSAIENARLYAFECQQRKMAEVLYETGAALSSTLNLDEVLDLLLDQLSRLVPYDAANVSLVEDGWSRIVRRRGYEQVDLGYDERVRGLSYKIDATPNLLQMYTKRQPIVIADTKMDPEWVVVDKRFPMRSWAGAPVVVQGKVVAFFSLDKADANFYQSEHLQPLGIFASQAGLALNNARLFAEMQRRVKESTLLSEVITLTASSNDLISALHQVCEKVAGFFNAQQAAFALLDEQDVSAKVIAEFRAPGRSSALGLDIPVRDNPSMAYVLEKKQPLAIDDAQNDPLLSAIHSIMVQREVASILIVPLILEGRVAGTLGIDMLYQYHFTPADIDLAKDIATQVSQVLSRLNLFKAIQNQVEGMALLAKLSEKLNQPLSVDEVLDSIGNGAIQLSGAQRAAIFIRQGTDSANCPWSQGLSPAYIDGVMNGLDKVPGGQLLHQPVPILIPDLRQLPADSYLGRLAQDEGILALGLWPLIYEGSVIAAIGLYFDDPRLWTPVQQEIMMAFSRQAAIALKNAYLFYETRWRAQQQEALNRMITVAVSAPDLATLMDEGLRLVMDALNTQIGGIWVEGHQATRGVPLQIQIDLSSPEISQDIIDIVTDVVAIPDWNIIDNPDYDRWKWLAEACTVRANLIVPLLARGQRIGVLAVGTHEPRDWNADETALLEAAGQQLGSAAERLDLLARTQEQARQVQQIVESVPDGVILLDEEKQVILANPVARSYLELLVDNYEATLPLTRLGDVQIEEALLLIPEKPWLEITTVGPPVRVFEVAGRPLALDVHLSGWVLVLRDITAERDNLKRAQIQERLATVGQLAAGIAHDFNNIMAAILVYTDLLTMDPHIPRSSRERLSIIQSQVQRATSLIRQILDFSRRAVIEQTQLDLLPLIKELEKMLHRVLPETISLSLEYQPGEYLVKADATRLQQALMNLSLNSRDSMPKGGELHFAISRLDLKASEVPPFPDLLPGPWVCIQVSDTGSGIPEDILPHIFDPFFTTKSISQGTGLGLAQVYGIVKQHGGSIDVRSTPGQGTIFYLYLPALEVMEKEVPALPQNGTPRGRGERVLVVEDDPVAREAIRILLDDLGYQVQVAANGREALKVYESDESWTDLVVSDLVMPEMGGVVLFRSLQEHDRTVKFLFITGHPMESHDQELLQAGGVQWLQKPFSAQELAESVRAILD